MSHHHAHSPSRLGRLYLCPGSMYLPQEESDPSDDAIQGTRCHHAVATGDDSGLTAEELMLVGLCRRQLSKVLGIHGPPKEVYTELFLDLRDGDDVVTAGTVDYVALYPDKGLVVDWKFGRVHASTFTGALQVGIYGAMVNQRFGGSCRPFLYQPRFDSWLEGDVLSHQEAVRLVRSITRPRDELILRPSPEACTYCPCQRSCPAPKYIAQAGVVSRCESNSLEVLEGWELGRLGQLAKVAEKSAETVIDTIKARLLKGEPVPGWKLVPRITQALMQDRS